MSERMVRTLGFSLFLVFLSVGVLFLLAPEAPLRGLNSLAGYFGMGLSPLCGTGFFSIMATAYMALVSILALRIFLHPDVALNPLLLAQAKAFSSLLSLGAFLFCRSDFILLVNGIVDGGLALLATLIYRAARIRERTKGSP
jgi:hypothetical protein